MTNSHTPTPGTPRRLRGGDALICATGLALPRKSIDNATLLSQLAPNLTGPRRDALLAGIEATIGSRSRHHLDATTYPDEGRAALVALSARAAQAAISACPAGFDATTISLHLHATSTPSRWTSPEAARIGATLDGALGPQTAFYDVRAGCTGGLHALHQACRFAAEADAPVLVTAADRFSRTAPPSERFAAFAFGDGAAAAIVMPPGCGIGYRLAEAAFGGIARHADLATVVAELPPEPDDAASNWYLSGDPEAFDAAARDALTTLARMFDVQQTHGSVPVLVSTSRVATARSVGGPGAFTEALETFGHLGTASLLAGLHVLLQQSSTPPPEIVMLGAGGGLSFGGARLVHIDTRNNGR